MEYFTSLYDENRWIKWKDFVGREKTGDQAQDALYPNLKNNEVITNITNLKSTHELKTGNEHYQNQGSKAEHRNINPSHHSHNLLHQRGASGDHHNSRLTHLKSRINKQHDGKTLRNLTKKE